MRPTSLLSGASRLPLTPKRANKDFYKGTRQSYVPGGGHRTGPPGAHVIRGKAKYRVDDTKVRFYVGPGIERIEATQLKPYVTTKPVDIPAAHLPPFSPTAPPGAETRFSKAYQALSTPQRNALIMDARRKWYAALAERFPAPQYEEGATKAVEARTK